jgi:enterochelin esterase-like enzyme
MALLIAAMLLFCVVAPSVQAQEQQAVESPMVRLLLEKAARKDRDGIDEFWSRLKASGTPLVEAIPDDPHESLVTFFWRGDSSTQNVVVISPLALVDLQRARMQQAPGTDIWYLTYRMRNDARMVYRMAPNDSLVPFESEPNFFARMSKFQRDPLNAKTFDYGGGMVGSLLELPGAPSDAGIQVRLEIPHGTLKEQKLSSTLLRNERAVWIYTPPGFDSARAYPLLVVMDGESYTTLVPTPVILDNLIHDEKIPPVVALFVGNASSQARDRELNCANEWGDFLVKEAIPWMVSSEHVRIETKNNLIAGSSMGGLAAACAAIQHSEVFGRVLAQSGSFYRAPAGQEPEWLARHLAESRRLPLDFYVEIGLLETSAIPSRDPSMLTASRHLRDVLVAKGYHVDFEERYGGHEHVAWRETFAIGLMELLGSPAEGK